MNPLIWVALVLTAATWLAGDADFRARPVSGSMNLSMFPGEPGRWNVAGPARNVRFTDNAIELHWREPVETRVTRSLPITPVADGTTPRLRISGRVQRLGETSLELVAARQPRFLVTYRRADKILQYGAVTRMTGQFGHQRFEYLVQPPAGSDTLELRWILPRAGHWRLHDVAITAVSINSQYLYVSVLLVVAWLLYLLWLSMIILRSASRPMMIGILLSLSVIVAGTGMGQATMTMLVQPVIMLLWSLFPEGVMPGMQTVLKTGHVLAFMLLTALLIRARGALHLSVTGSVLLAVVLAAASESLQRHRFNRSPELRDVLIDCIGIALALLIFALWSQWRQRRQRAAGAVQSPAGGPRA